MKNAASTIFNIATIGLMTFSLLMILVGDKFSLATPDVADDWLRVMFGAVMIGMSSLAFLVGRIAFARNDTELKRSLLIGLMLWLGIEALGSLYYGVYKNVVIDFVMLPVLSWPLLKR